MDFPIKMMIFHSYVKLPEGTEKWGGWQSGVEVDYGSLQKEIENQLRIAKLQATWPGSYRKELWVGLGIDPPYMILHV